MSRITGTISSAALIGVLGVNAASTYDDYFIKWPNHPETQFVFQADFAAIAKDIDASDVMDVSVGGLSNDTMDDRVYTCSVNAKTCECDGLIRQPYQQRRSGDHSPHAIFLDYLRPGHRADCDGIEWDT